VVVILAVAGVVRLAGLPPPAGLEEPMVPRRFWEHGYVWREFCHACLLTPLFEDMLYRGVLTPALERLSGTRLAILGSGVAWTCLHVVYARPIALAPFYAVSGMLGGWIFLKARSLVPLVVLHTTWNAAVEFGFSLLVLRARGFISDLFGWPLSASGGDEVGRLRQSRVGRTRRYTWPRRQLAISEFNVSPTAPAGELGIRRRNAESGGVS
jgi:membrane protease YdiL (CAAX protease family)